jgi:hypothetical protein
LKNEEILEQFYSSFQKGDAQGMSACYHDSVTFTDPAFGRLTGKEVGAMWGMLLSRKESELKIEYSGISTTEKSGEAQWIATYKYGPEKRSVVNKIRSRFKFRDDKIIEQVDDFNLWAWSRQALGPVGLLLGWTPLLRNKIQGMARKALLKYMNIESS